MVSGGQDSMTLLHLLAGGLWGGMEEAGAGRDPLPRPRSVTCLHVNHHLRGEESEADQRLVEATCAGLGLSLEVVHCPIDKAAGNVQEEAREARRAAARRAAARWAAAGIATGHTLDDQVETLLYRLGRYGGPASLRAMKPRDGLFIRPLLAVRRVATEAYCRAMGLDFAVDRGNNYPGYARTRIRQALMPAWEEAVPGAAEAAARAAELVGEMMEAVGPHIAAALAGASPGGGARKGPWGVEGLQEFSAERLRCLPYELRRLVLHRLLECHEGTEVTRARVEGMDALLSGPACAHLSLGGGWSLQKHYDRVRLQRADPAQVTHWAGGCAGAPAVDLPVPGQVRWNHLELTAQVGYPLRAGSSVAEVFVDARSLSPALRVRAWQPGDRLRPLGAGGNRKVQDIFTEARVPRHLRHRVPLFVAGERIVWVGGLCVSEESRICRATQTVSRLAISSETGMM